MFVASYFVGFYERRIMQRLWLIFAAVLGLATMSVPASAAIQTTTYTIAYNSSAGTITGGFNFGTVTLAQNSSNTNEVTVSVQLNTSITGIGFANTGAGYAIAWDLAAGPVGSTTSIAFDAANVNNSNFTIEAVNGSYNAAPFTSGTNGNAFNYAIDYNAANGTDQSLIFDVTRSTGLALTDFIGNPNWLFALDIITKTGGTAVTRNVGVKAPEPETWMLFLAGLAALTALTVVQRRRKLAQAV